MQKTAKKFLSMLLALMMVLSILPTAVFATEQATVAAPLDSIVPYGANDQTTGTATISVQNPVTFTGYSAFENVPYYLVTVPAGTTYVKATYKDAAILTNATSGEASGYYADVPQWTGGGVEMAYTESNGDITITIPLNYSRTAEDGTTVQKSFVLGADGSGTAYAPEYDGSAKSTAQTATAKTRAEMDSADFVTTMNTGMAGTFGSSRYSPALSWQTGLIGLTTPTKGNVNLDPFGYVDEEDLALLQEWVDEGKDINQLTLEQRAQADMDGSGALDEVDVNALIQYLEDPRENPL